METGSMLLEKSIAMTGEVLDEKSVWQGGPATLWFRSKAASLYMPPDLIAGKVDKLGEQEIEMGSLRK